MLFPVPYVQLSHLSTESGTSSRASTSVPVCVLSGIVLWVLCSVSACPAVGGLIIVLCVLWVSTFHLYFVDCCMTSALWFSRVMRLTFKRSPMPQLPWFAQTLAVAALADDQLHCWHLLTLDLLKLGLKHLALDMQRLNFGSEE